MGHKVTRDRWVLSFWRLPLALASAIVILDQVTKWLVMTAWEVGGQTVVIPGFFNLVHFRNPGAAWGMFADHTLVLAAVSMVVLFGLILGFERLVEGCPERALALGAVAGGIVGNLIDRLLHLEVVDFLLFYWRQYQWPAFNIADSAISCGVFLFILSSFLRSDDREGGQTAAQATGDADGLEARAHE